MAGLIGYFKGAPTEYILKYTGGRVSREGSGLSFYYLTQVTSIVAVPTSSTDGAFVFNETTRSFQSVTIQGQFTYRIAQPRRAAELLNFTIDSRSTPERRVYVSTDPEKVPQRIANIIQMETRAEVQQRSLEATLAESQVIAGQVLQRIRTAELLAPMGVDLLSVYFLAAKPTPEVGKALEAEYRETLLRRADEAIYARRAAAVEEERKIKENELNTDITLEEQRQQLLTLQGSNAEQEAEFKSRALAMELEAYRGMPPQKLLALAMRSLGESADRIGNLTITSEILAALLQAQPTDRE